MKPENRKILLGTALYLLCMSGVTAQPKSAGTSFSINGIEASYEHFIDSESFIEVNMKAECADMFFGRSTYPGASASVIWNMIIGERKSCNGNTLRFFAGPGLMLGWGSDLMRPPGLLAGLKGRIGAECEYDRNVTISISVSPTIGTHTLIFEEYTEMRYYRAGLISAVLPVIGIKYTF